MSNTPEPYWKVGDVAALINMSKSFVYKEAEAGRLPCVRIGSALRFKPDEIRAYLERQRASRASVLTLRR
jgi:excisionase family DNA binding protein